MPTYPDTARALLVACDASGELGLAEIKSTIWSSSQRVVAVDEKAFRDFLQAAEGRLDVTEHTTDTESVYEATMPIVREVRDRVAAYLST